ncbi:RPS5-like 1 [Hibiscus trionum]|uniref:RPS5-like 1 n=1 Tax=Hibiscus trionum TaxID=183268 RepID=A0A9W7HL99_HIBTR|nr:RPS5-like 1 [Hibiscus trionum]
MDFVLNKIDKHLDNHMSFDQYRKDLKRKLKELNGLKEDIESTMSIELRPRKKLKTEVQIWLKNVERINGEVRDLDGRIDESNALTRRFRAEDVLASIREVEELITQQGKFHGGLVVDNLQWIGQVLTTSSLSGEAVKACIEKIWQCLMDDEVSKIGVWGMAGVGKTSIVKLINNQLLEERGKFDIVIWITVSKEMSIAKLQKDIASKIGVEFCGDEDETTRAGMLFETLLRKSRFVMILDDLWEKVSLERIGIPEPSVGSKLVLTTRSSDVCRQMGCGVIKVERLTEEEAWKLFLEKVGGDILNIPGVEPIARSIAKHCAGLPLGIITIASCMKGIDDICEWRNALKELSLRQESVNGFEDEVFQQLQFSYDRLKDPKLQQCFLSCALYPEDDVIKEGGLIQLWIAEGLVEEMDSMQAEFDRGRAIMNRLISNCLLEVFTQIGDRRFVKMHDLLRDMALHIAKSRFLVKAGMMLEKPPAVQEWSMELEKVSLMENRRLRTPYPLEVLPPKCPRLTTLLLHKCGIAGIPEGFFDHMDALKTLDLSQNPIESLPHSISNLKNLTSLLLAYCDCLENVPSLSNLQVLKNLDLQRTKIKQIPRGMENLVSLEYLNLDDCRNLTEIPNGILSRLSCLQDLNVGRTLISGKEVGGLKKLENLEGRFHNWHNLNMYLQGQAFHGRDEPRQYTIYVGGADWFARALYDARKAIFVRDCNIHTYPIMLPPAIEKLKIMDCNLDGSADSEYPLFSSFILFSPNSFSSLMSLEIYGCRNMKKLFSLHCVPLNLYRLIVDKCEELEEIIASEGGMVTMEFRLPQLRELELRRLPELKSICSVDSVLVCDSLEEIWVKDCSKLQRMGLNPPQLDNAPPSSASLSIRIRMGPKEWWESVEWDAKPLLEPFTTII